VEWYLGGLACPKKKKQLIVNHCSWKNVFLVLEASHNLVMWKLRGLCCFVWKVLLRKQTLSFWEGLSDGLCGMIINIESQTEENFWDVLIELASHKDE
jgi:hypothetical protein